MLSAHPLSASIANLLLHMSFLEAVSLTTKPMTAPNRSSPPRQSVGHFGICLGRQWPMIEENIRSPILQRYRNNGLSYVWKCATQNHCLVEMHPMQWEKLGDCRTRQSLRHLQRTRDKSERSGQGLHGLQGIGL
ncbi:hypothetical protein EDB80DRAFT_207882 [Ilyonectria destructans]|nr:hypothetical protein EDB80DRAFT_207882 [Ilyonectria destructans]